MERERVDMERERVDMGRERVDTEEAECCHQRLRALAVVGVICVCEDVC